jgi:radical SAM protein with 4Fe4S-binding SPASM domain
MSEALANQVMDQVIEAEVLSVCLTGGEPLSNYKIVKLILERCKGTRIKVTMNSNVTLLTEQRLQELKDLRLFGFFTSVLGSSSQVHDTITGVNGSFEKTINAIKLCHQFGFIIHPNMVVSRLNLEDILQTAKMLKNIGCQGMNLDTASCPVNCSDFSELALTREEQLKVFNSMLWIESNLGMSVRATTRIPYCIFPELNGFELFLYSKCTAGIALLSISSDGEVRVCPKDSSGNVGLLTNSNLLEIWRGLEDYRTDVRIPYKCKACKLLPKCGSGCRFAALQATGKIDGQDPLMNADGTIQAYKLLQGYMQNKIHNVLQARQIIFNDFVLRDEEFGAVVWDGSNMQLINKDGSNLLRTVRPGIAYSLDDSMFINCKNFIQSLAISGLLTVN